MFSIGEHVFHQNTGHIGQVIGYGHQLNNVEAITLKVLVAYAEKYGKRGVIEEDLDSFWTKWPDTQGFHLFK